MVEKGSALWASLCLHSVYWQKLYLVAGVMYVCRALVGSLKLHLSYADHC
jgi:hypothetical protein